MFEELSANADDKLFKNIESNNNHVLHHLKKILLNITFVIGCIIILYRLKMTEIL